MLVFNSYQPRKKNQDIPVDRGDESTPVEVSAGAILQGEQQKGVP